MFLPSSANAGTLSASNMATEINMLFITIHFSAGWYSFTASSKQLDAKFAAASFAVSIYSPFAAAPINGSRGRKKMPPQLVARGPTLQCPSDDNTRSA